ncbi:MAG TPA: hypothetical protein IGS17_07955 [Oscillatoriales cyanobacterium M59_W2019_021]|nr:hypothetical protein [Oscillatoriales cyanobacterium M4454_W2019_049]HIK50840.1 hypothetical protein [Oscillatoriales cyanobacterium M59_W2019_021]
MTHWEIKPELVRLLSDITGQPLRSPQITPLFVFFDSVGDRLTRYDRYG